MSELMNVLLIVIIFLTVSFVGVPISFSLLFASIVSLVIMGVNVPFIALIQRMTRGLDSFCLLAIPLFLFAGNLMNNLGIARRIFEFALVCVGHIKGGLAHVNIIASTIFAGMSGAAQADAAGLGIVEMEAMKREGYDVNFSAAITAASSTIGPVIPPSVTMVIYVLMVRGVSLARLFLAGIIPGIMMCLSFMGLIYLLAINNKIKGNIRKKEKWQVIFKTFWNTFPCLLAPIVLVSGMLLGFATPTELGAITVVYVFFLGIIYRDVTIDNLLKSLTDTVINIGVLIFIISCAFTFGYIITLLQIPNLTSEFVFSIASSREGVLAIVVSILIVMGTFMESTAIEILFFPILAPIVKSVGVDLVQFGIIAVLAILMGALTPPFGICLYIVSHIGDTSIWKVSKMLIPYYILFILFLIILMYFPSISLFLPNLLLG